MNYLFTSESVSEGHPDKVSDQISDAILDEFLRQDPEAKVACETFCSTGLVVVGGEVRSEDAYVDIQTTARRVINKIGYNKAEYMFDGNSCGVLSALHEQSADINRGVDAAAVAAPAVNVGGLLPHNCLAVGNLRTRKSSARHVDIAARRTPPASTMRSGAAPAGDDAVVN